MGADIYVTQHLKTASGKLYELNTVSCPYLTNNDLHFQTECRFLMDWAPAALKRVHPDEVDDPDSCYGDFYITVTDVRKLIVQLNKALTYEYDSNRKAKLKKVLPWLHPDSLETELRYYLFEHMRKAVQAFSVMLQYEGDPDSVFILTIS